MVSIDGLSDGDITKWRYFEQMDVTEFLHKLLYAKRKADAQRRKAELDKIKSKR